MEQRAIEQPDWLERLIPHYGGNRRLLAYVFGVVGLGVGLLFFRGGGVASIFTVPFLAWFGFNLLSELLWLETGTGEATDSMAMTMNFAVIMLFDFTVSLAVIGLSVLLATRFIQRRDWFRAAFGLGQMVVTAFVAGTIFRWIYPTGVDLATLLTTRAILALIGCGTVYFFTNTFLVAAAVALERRSPFWPTWSNNYGYRNSVVSSIALFSLSPILILSFLSIGYAGAVLFFLPLLIVKNQNREYINLQKMTQALISTERMAAKGEMAAEVAHEINNYLAVLSGRTQLLSMKAERTGDTSMRSDADVIRQQVAHMSTLAKGLLEFSHRGIRVQKIDLNRLIVETLDFVQPQNLFDGFEFVPELLPDLGEVEADGGQLQQVLINLLRNAADAIHEQEDRAPDDPPRLVVRTGRDRKGNIRISVMDNGPGMSAAVREKIFEPAFTTKQHGHGYGLATCYRILQNHGGRIWAESEPGHGTVFHLELPRKSDAARRPTNGAADGGRGPGGPPPGKPGVGTEKGRAA